jgi:hypothetical protein
VDESFLAIAHSIPWLMYIVACTGLAYEADRLRASAQISSHLKISDRNFVTRDVCEG